MKTNNLHKITYQVNNIAIQAGIVINQHYKGEGNGLVATPRQRGREGRA